MADLADLQSQLRADSNLRGEFVSDPGAVLQRFGITLSADQLDALRQQLQRRNLAGGVMPPDPQAVSVGVTVGN